MAMNDPYQKYQQNSIMTSTPEELTLMLYNGIIKFLNQSVVKIEEKNTEEAHINIIKAQNIIRELMVTLDMKYDISNDLFELYDFMHNELVQANFHKFDDGVQKINNVLLLVKDLRDTWQEAMKIIKTQNRKSG